MFWILLFIFVWLLIGAVTVYVMEFHLEPSGKEMTFDHLLTLIIVSIMGPIGTGIAIQHIIGNWWKEHKHDLVFKKKQ